MRTFLGLMFLAFAVAVADAAPIVALVFLLALALFCLWELVTS